MLHLERLKTAIDAMSHLTAERQQQCESDTAQALRWLTDAPEPAELRARLVPVVAGGGDWAGALPATAAPLDARLVAAGDPPHGAVLIAVDGSQVYPDPHAAVLYYLLQIGGLAFRYDGSRPTPYSCESLHFRDDELYDAQGYPISSEQVGMRRLVREMEYLAELTTLERHVAPAAPLMALTDGPLLWPYIERSRADSAALEAYLAAMSEIRQAGGLPVGYVARPGGRTLVELLWAGQLSPADIPGRLADNPLRGLTDAILMAHFLRPGERSAWFSRPSATNQRQADHGHEVWFCYVNVGTEHAPVIARLETPHWGAIDEDAITALHVILLHQARVLNGYPYALARAHEEALVTTADKAALDSEIQRHILEQGIVVRPSEKAQQKAYLGRR
ncbi:MAG TPA: DNA double-strand break repair nuclease NurA [Anaerolineae bacterium]|mgnify:CR=1 FL=1|nr:DNA double-strand break repair nuclease NurA [Anaerolineae bacterium]HQH38626.1 DNA double-strand break repair nuclease NurA [Anaerolineae bacterium]